MRVNPSLGATSTLVESLVTFGVVYALPWRGGLEPTRLVLVGIGAWFSTTALTILLVARANPWETPRYRSRT